MRDLEKEIAAWRERLIAAMPAERWAELEEHLHEDIARRRRAGSADLAALDAAVERFGDPRVIARAAPRHNRGAPIIFRWWTNGRRPRSV